MAVFAVPNVSVKGVAASVPRQIEDNTGLALLPEKDRELFIKTVGIRYRRVAEEGTTAADLCYAAAEKLLAELQWGAADIRVLVFVTQTPDYLIPNSASILQERLGLPKSCIAFDVNLGCSGYVYGLSIINSLLQNMPGGRGLLLVGDVSTAIISKEDKSTTPLFSDAGSATALEYTLNSDIHFNLQTDGKEYDDIIVPDGGFRNRVNERSFEAVEHEKGIVRRPIDMKLDGVKIFNFALREIAPNINQLLSELKKDKNDIDYYIFHQANLLMLESVRRKLQVDAARVPYSLYDFGNTSSATIPVTMVTKLRKQLSDQSVKLLISGFGVGLSWGSAYIETGKIVCLPLIEV